MQVKQSGLAQQQRCFAEAAVAPKFDWESLESSIQSDEGRRDLASLRSTFIDVQQKFDSMSQVSHSCAGPFSCVVVLKHEGMYLNISQLFAADN